MQPVNILITASGTTAAINIIKALKKQVFYEPKIHAVDPSPLAAGAFLADVKAISPYAISDKFIPFLIDFCQKYKIQYLFPCLSNEIELIAKHRADFLEIGVDFLLSNPEVIALCNDKIRCAEKVSSLGISTPKIYFHPSCKDMPLFVKPIQGSSSRGSCKVESEDHLNFMLSKNSNSLLFQEFIPGQEYTVDCLVDRNQNLIFCAPRSRIQVKSGQVYKSQTVDDPELQQLSKKILYTLGLCGVCNLQFIKNEKGTFFIELNPRYGAGSILSFQAGGNLPLLSLQIMENKPLPPYPIPYQKNLSMTRYTEEIFIDEPISQ